MKNLHESFKNVFTYSAGIESWVKEAYKSVCGRKLKMTFPMDFAIADWSGKDEVLDTYKNVVEAWGGNYKAFTEIAVSLAYLSYAQGQLKKQGISGRDEFIDLYADLFYKAKDDFYEKFKGNDEATDWFFEWTD